jgi:hypothetical protein
VNESKDEPHVSPFSSRYTVLKFKSDTKSDQDKLSLSNNHSAPSQKNFVFKKPANLIDFNIGDQLMGKGIFQQQDQNVEAFDCTPHKFDDNLASFLSKGKEVFAINRMSSTNTSMSHINSNEENRHSIIPTTNLNPEMLIEDFGLKHTRTMGCFDIQHHASPDFNFKTSPYLGIGEDEA